MNSLYRISGILITQNTIGDELENPKLVCTDALEYMRSMTDNSVNLILVDPPYFKVKDEPWDRQWDTRDGFLAWMAELCEQFQRILVSNGSLYLFASPQMSWFVEGVVRERFNIINHIVWAKPDPKSMINQGASNSGLVSKEILRGFYPNTERIIFAEHFNSDNIAKGEAGYVRKCDELRGFVFEPLRAYLSDERIRAGFTTRQVAQYYQKKTGSRTITRMAGHWFERVQWTLPTEENYQWLRNLFNNSGEYKYLRREYEDLRRPFNATPDAPYTDVWTFPTVTHYHGKHPCEKPVEMLEHIINISSRPDDVVFDCFMGSGNTGMAAALQGRSFIGIDASERYFKRANRRVMAAYQQWDNITHEIPKEENNNLDELPLFRNGDEFDR